MSMVGGGDSQVKEDEHHMFIALYTSSFHIHFIPNQSVCDLLKSWQTLSLLIIFWPGREKKMFVVYKLWQSLVLVLMVKKFYYYNSTLYVYNNIWGRSSPQVDCAKAQ